MDHPEFTEPVTWQGLQVPEVIRSGNHALIDQWRMEQSIINTIQKHFDWLRSFDLNKKEVEEVKKFIPVHYVALMHGDIVLKEGRLELLPSPRLIFMI